MMIGIKFMTADQASTREIPVFTKFLEKLLFGELAATIAPLGVAGLEAPLRKAVTSSIDSFDKKG